MNNNLREQIYNNLLLKDTEDLLEIWQSGSTSEWSEEAFEIVKEILVERLGSMPPRSTEAQALQLLRTVERYLEEGQLEKALSECERVIQMKPDLAIAYNYRGEVYEETGQLENAITSYQKAIQLDPQQKDAWENMARIEVEIEEEFKGSLTKQRLDQALEYAYNGEAERALQECETAMSAMPSIAIAYNYLGMVLQTLDQLEPAIDAYLKAVQLNPRFYAARENLANARVKWEEEQYIRISNLVPEQVQEGSETNTEFDEELDAEIMEGKNPVPGWVYLDANAFLLPGWAGYRNRPGRSGYDPLERDFELAHIEGVIIRRLITSTFRTRNPIYLLFMAGIGLMYALCSALSFVLWKQMGILPVIFFIPYLIIGIGLLVNVYLSLQLYLSTEQQDNGSTFF